MATTETISQFPAGDVAKLTGAAVLPADDSVAATVKYTLAQVRTVIFAGTAGGYTATDPLTVGAITSSGVLTITAGGLAVTGNSTITGTLGGITTLTATTVVAALTGNVTGNVSGSSGSTTGNAATATALQTARAINGTNFDGTAAITVTAAAGTLTGGTLAAGVTASSLTSLGTLTGLTVAGTSKVQQVKELTTISATAATGTVNYDVLTQALLYYTSSAAANWTLNVRASSGASLDSIMSTGESITIVHMVTQGATAYYNNVVTIDGGANTPKWLGGTAPTAGNVSGIDIYTYAIIKTGSATFTVIASQTQAK